MSTIYTVHVEDEMGGSVAAPTLEEAYRLRAQCGPLEGRIQRITVSEMPMRRLLCAIYNREGFAAEQVEIAPEWRGR